MPLPTCGQRPRRPKAKTEQGEGDDPLLDLEGHQTYVPGPKPAMLAKFRASLVSSWSRTMCCTSSGRQAGTDQQVRDHCYQETAGRM